MEDNDIESSFSEMGKVSAIQESEPVIDYNVKPLIYSVNENPPINVTLLCAFQQGLLSLASQLIVSLLVAEAVCASNNNIVKARLLSSTIFMSGFTTVAMNLFGTRLPLFQGAASEYVIPLLLVASVEGSFCSSLGENTEHGYEAVNATVIGNQTDVLKEERILYNIRALQGSLMLAGLIQAMLGFTGLIGVLLRFVGPLTIVPTMVLLFVFIVRPVLKFVESSWPIALSTVAVACILFLYLSKYNMPIPVWTPSGGCRIIRYPLHQVFAMLISIVFNWALCGILTISGVFTDNTEDIEFQSRTDARSQIIADNPWFSFPYPGQYGDVGFSGPAFISCIIATLISVLDSVGDYYACARVCRVPAPPSHAVNRGILIEGLCSMLSGAAGAGHATTTYGESIGAIGVTKIASRKVFLFTGVLYMLFGIFGKFSAVFITIPHPVLGGATIIIFGIFFGVVLSNLQVTNMSSPRNIAILGLSVFIGLMVPTWVEKVKHPVHTGDETADKIIGMLLGNPTLVGAALALFLDNTVPGTREERGIAAWHVGDSENISDIDSSFYYEGYEVYNPLIPERFLRMSIVKYIPFLPHRKSEYKSKGKTVRI